MANIRSRFKGVEFWNGHIDNYRASGLSIKEYCSQQKISRSSLHTYLSKKGISNSAKSQPGFLEISPPSSGKPAVTRGKSIIIISLGEIQASEIANLVKALP